MPYSVAQTMPGGLCSSRTTVRTADLVALLLVLIVLLCPGPTRGEEAVSYERDVRPILKTHCFHCHGEAGKREGGLDLRLRRFIVHGGESGPSVQIENSEESLLYQRIRDGEMPPDDKQISVAEANLIQRWIDQGAKTLHPEPESISDEWLSPEERSFWAFQPIRRPAAPALETTEELSSPIDHFVLRGLHANGLGFSAPASRGTLIRRMTFDLLGMPPTPDEIEQFESDASPDAVARLLDRLLSSPRYGERWGRHWLDIAGYADSEGYTDEDRERPWAYRYRDYVIRSLNQDKPFDRFVQEQLAGDEMAGAKEKEWTPQQVEKLTATGFLRMAPDGTASGGIDQGVARNEVVADTLRIVSTSLLGLTVGCARCHNHRYDPISQADYYRLRAVFEPALDWKQWKTPPNRLVSLYTDADRNVKAAIEAEAAKVDAEREEKTKQYIDRTLEEELLTLDESLREPLREAYKTPGAKRTQAQKDLLKEHPSVANISPGSLYLYDRRREERARKLDIARQAKEKKFVADTRQQALDALDAEVRDAVLAAEKTAEGSRSNEQRTLLSQYPALRVTAANLAEFNAEAVAELKRDQETAERLRAEKAADDLKRYTAKAAEIREAIPKEHFVRALSEPADHTPKTYLFVRGDHEQPKGETPPADLAVLNGEPFLFAENDPDRSTSGRRLAYAQRLTSKQHPLLARVFVNRVWAHHFGRGLVDSLGDFGLLGERPSHPELLDWLASEFMDSDWSVKQLHRAMMLSRTYQQTSVRTEQLDNVDPDNRWYGRMAVRRLESEVVRDAVLRVCGDLNDKMFGTPVPVMEDEVGQIVLGKENLDGERKPVNAIPLGGEEYRRSLYIQVRRTRPLSVLETFDSPAMTPNCTERVSSNVAAQPLMMMNSQFSISYAKRLADRLLRECGDDRQSQIRRGWLIVLGERPSVEQVAEAEAFLDLQTQVFGEQKGDGPTPEESALTSLCQVWFSSNRFLYID